VSGVRDSFGGCTPETGHREKITGMRPVRELFADYADHHRTSGNKRLHRLGIPLIVFSLLGLLAHIHLGWARGVELDAALLLIVISELYYFLLEWRLALAMLVVSGALYFLARALPLPVLWLLFIAGWILQFVGHAVYEKRQPAFARNLVHLLIGPLWILNDIIGVTSDK
jgi:uncharacterized membrane protein YGL010W